MRSEINVAKIILKIMTSVEDNFPLKFIPLKCIELKISNPYVQYQQFLDYLIHSKSKIENDK